MTIAILVMLGIGATCGIILSVASKVFYVYEDPRIAEVEYFLAGANCGGCGFAGCGAAAVAIVEGKAAPSICVAADSEAAVNIATMQVGRTEKGGQALMALNVDSTLPEVLLERIVAEAEMDDAWHVEL